jgi:hypothetical protein
MIYKFDRRIHSHIVVDAESVDEAKEKIEEQDFIIEEILDDTLKLLDEWEE